MGTQFQNAINLFLGKPEDRCLSLSGCIGVVSLGMVSLAGCQGRAINDVYFENMASEIRELEDQLYEYDHEYQLLEQELANLRRQNAALRGNTQSDYSEPKRSPNFGFDDPSGSLDMGSSILGDGGTAAPKESPAVETPESPFPGTGSDDFPDAGDSNSDLLNVPNIEMGEPIPPPLPVLTDASTVDPQADLELNLSRVEIPSKLASASLGSAKIEVAKQKVTDKRVVELGFDPTLCRAVNLDNEADDDGIYLVLKPRNKLGQFVPEAADLSIVILDPVREDESARIGRWDYSAAKVREKLVPIGTGQGIQLTLPWNGPDPTADRVIVFARYTFPNGRMVIGEREVMVNIDGRFQTVWTPRGGTIPASYNSPSPTGVSSAVGQSGRVVRPTASIAEQQPPAPVGW